MIMSLAVIHSLSSENETIPPATVVEVDRPMDRIASIASSHLMICVMLKTFAALLLVDWPNGKLAAFLCTLAIAGY